MRGLSINGGGIRILITVELLIRIEKETGKRITDLFDYAAGTSGGSILVSMIDRGYSPEECKDLILNNCKDIFKKRHPFSMGVFTSKYSGKSLQRSLRKFLGEGVVLEEGSGLFEQVLIPSIDRMNRPKIFKKNGKVSYTDAVMASCSAPYYFPLHKIGSDHYADGGLVYNNPSALLKYEAESKGLSGIDILNITTGRKEDRLIKKAGILNIPKTINYLLQVQDNKTTSLMKYLYGNVDCKYLRVDPAVKFSSGKIDDITIGNLNNMTLDGQIAANSNINEILTFLSL